MSRSQGLPVLSPLVSRSSPSQLPDWKKRSRLLPGGGSIPLAGRTPPAQWDGNCEGRLSPALTGRNDPGTSGKLAVPSQPGLAVPSPALHLPVLAGGFCAAHQPPTLCPTTPYVPPAKEPPPRWAPATLTVPSLREQ